MGILEFYSILDFYPKRDMIREKYKTLTIDEIILYKKVVYSLCFEREYIKDLIWEYLNEWDECKFKLAKEYRKKKIRNDKNTLKIIELERYNQCK